MSVFDFFHNFFGNSHKGNGRPPEYEGSDNFGFSKPHNPHWNPDFEDDDMMNFSSMFDFKMMTDPLEMHQFLEQKVNEMMKSFISPEELPGFQGFGVFESPDVPAITERQDPRDHYLKPGAKIPSPSEKSGDEKSAPTTTWLDKLIPSLGLEDGKPMQPHTFSSFKSVTRRTVTLPDGTVKTEEIIRNSDGTEERTESHSKSDGSGTPLFDSPFVGPDFSGLFGPPKTPEYKDPRYQFLKPGYEKFNPNSEKIDKDLDKQIEQSGVESLPPFTKEPEYPQPIINGAFKSFTRRIVTLPNGVVESEEIIRNPDGTEQKTVTHTWPDGTTKSVTGPATGKNKQTLTEGYDTPVLSLTLRGIKDFIDMFYK